MGEAHATSLEPPWFQEFVVSDEPPTSIGVPATEAVLTGRVDRVDRPCAVSVSMERRITGIAPFAKPSLPDPPSEAASTGSRIWQKPHPPEAASAGKELTGPCDTMPAMR